MRGEGRWLVAGALLLVALAALLLLIGRDDPPPRTAATPPAPARVNPPPVSARGDDLPTPPPEQVAPIHPEAPPPIALPPDTQALAEEFVPGTTDWEEVPLAEGRRETIRFVPAQYNVIAPQPIVLYLEVVDPSGKKLDAALPRARVRPFDGGDWIEAAMRDDGRGGDEVAGDHRYTASFAPAWRGRVAAEGIVELAGAGVRRVPQALIYTNGPRAKLTGRWRDELKDGHLHLSAEVAVDAPGTFTLMLQLVGPSRQPIAIARAITTLPAGLGWITVRVWGKAIHDAEVDGPYEVRNVLLTRDTGGDYDPGPTILSAHHTRPYRAKDFSDAAYEDTQPVVESGRKPSDPAPLHGDSERMTGRISP